MTFSRAALALTWAGVAAAQGPEATRAATVDERVAAFWQAPARQENTGLRRTMQIADRITSPGLLIAAPLAYGAFRLSGNVSGATYALRAGEAMVLGTVVTSALKLTLGRARPYASARSDDWALGRGVRGAAWQAFPSGHTTVAFATASALTLMAAQHSTGAGVMVGAVTLAGASAAGVARLYLNKHWATDVLAGAGVGLLAGAGVMAWHRSAGGARLDRALLGVSITDGAMRPLLGMW